MGNTYDFLFVGFSKQFYTFSNGEDEQLLHHTRSAHRNKERTGNSICRKIAERESLPNTSGYENIPIKRRMGC